MRDRILQLKLALQKSDISKTRNIMGCRDSTLAKSKETSRDDSIKRFSVQPHPTYFSALKICRVGLLSTPRDAVFVCYYYAINHDLLLTLLILHNK